jgi:hypothetical protein
MVTFSRTKSPFQIPFAKKASFKMNDKIPEIIIMALLK